MSDLDPVDAFLAHNGVKGMKWGVRKSQTTAHMTITDPHSGRSASIHYNPTKARVVQEHDGTVHIHTSSKKHRDDISRQIHASVAKTMTDEQLRAHVNRINLEKQYHQATSHPSTSKGKKLANKALKTSLDITSNVAKQVVTQRLTKAVNDAIDTQLKK